MPVSLSVSQNVKLRSLQIDPASDWIYTEMMNNVPDNREILKALEALESRVSEMLKLTVTLKQENAALRHQNESLLSERNELIGQKATVKSSVEGLITRLRAMESA